VEDTLQRIHHTRGNLKKALLVAKSQSVVDVLVVGDGDLSFSSGLKRHLTAGEEEDEERQVNLVATTFDSFALVKKKYGNATHNIASLARELVSGRGVGTGALRVRSQVFFGVDASDLKHSLSLAMQGRSQSQSRPRSQPLTHSQPQSQSHSQSHAQSHAQLQSHSQPQPQPLDSESESIDFDSIIFNFPYADVQNSSASDGFSTFWVSKGRHQVLLKEVL
jgi:hypothetical protein